jgi:hypothetical protein
MTTILSYDQWVEITDRGTSGDQVDDILASWNADREKLREQNWDGQNQINAEIQSVVNGAVAQYAERNAILRQTLEAVEWVVNSDGDELCPWCYGDKYATNWKEAGHTSDCLRQHALGLDKVGALKRAKGIIPREESNELSEETIRRMRDEEG